MEEAYVSIKDIMVNTIESIETRYESKTGDPDYIDAGFCCLEFHKGDLIVLAARPSVGKTAFALSLVNQLALNKKIPVGYISLDSTEKTLFGRRLISINSGVPLGKVHTGMMKTSEVGKVHNSANAICEAPLYLINELNGSFDTLEWKAQMLIDEKQVQLIIIDGFELFEELVDSEKGEYRDSLKKLLEKLKKFAEEHHIPIILEIILHPDEHNKEPSLRDFGKHMIIPYMADMILLIHRDNLQEKIEKQEVEFYIEKNLRGWAGRHIPLYFDPQTVAFYREKQK